MKKIISLIKCVLGSPTLMFLLIFLVSFGSLAAAFIAEGFFGLEPCELCIYQRYPFAIGMVIGIIGLAMRKKMRVAATLMVITALNFITNSGIAFYHTGVELKWWESSDACKMPDFGDNGKSLIENIMSNPGGRCDEIPWADPILGLSMANYNVILCFGLFVACLLSAVLIYKKGKPRSEDAETPEDADASAPE